jgi:adenylate cyclase
MAKEIEKKFLCKKDVNAWMLNNGMTIHQVYLHVDDEKQMRVRIVNDHLAYFCIKYIIGDGVERDEFEYQIPYEDAKYLYDKADYKFKKVRYSDKTAEGFHIDIDCYNDGVVIAEVELPSRDVWFSKPMYFGEEVTGKHEYCNYHYAGIPEYKYKK